MKVSNCCGEPVHEFYMTTELCPKCGEHCEYVEEEETQKTALMELISELHQWAADKYCLYSEEQIKVVRDVINRATELLQKERKQIEEAFLDAINRGDDIFPSTAHSLFEDYYNETYK